MGRNTGLWFCCLSFMTTIFLPFLAVSIKQTYIVHMKHDKKPSTYTTHHDWYSAHLQSLTASSASSVSDDSDSDSLLYTYTTAFNGFAASLEPDQVESLRQSDLVVDVYEESIYTLHTTRTPEFLGLENQLGLWEGHNIQDLNQASHDVIIGVLDTGIWPESKSFDDSDMPSVPARWKGECESGVDFSASLCNKKLIGAKSFSKGYHMAVGNDPTVKNKENPTPRDVDGHGTHTASTAAGVHVGNASLFGYASGIARGMATAARVAAYKVCWSTGCFGSDILAGMDRAITDGVDVLSMSLGGGSGPYYRDTVAIGSFTAMEKGIFVSCSAGNSGPGRATLSNVAPWIMTVGAGTIDRDFPAYAVLGDGKRFTGVSLYSGQGMGNKSVELVYINSSSSSNLCMPGSLEPELVRGKVVLCDRGGNSRVDKGLVVKQAGGVGMILANTAASGEELVADSHLLPAVAVGKKVGDQIREYVRTEGKPRAALSFGGTVLNVRPSPVVAAFSSRGPNLVTPQILKPDVIGPGVNILAAWSDALGPTGLEQDTRRTPFNIMSGTSMSCPHISGLAALLKAAHPQWSPSAIKSALMTTAYTKDNTNSPLKDAADGSISTPHVYGAGHVDPRNALSPGLVYDISSSDYITFLCSLGYAVAQIETIVKHNVSCSRKFRDPGQLNYPSFSVLFQGNSRPVRYTRELTNVGAAGSVYTVSVEAGAEKLVAVTVKPTRLVFKKVGDKMRYTVTFVSLSKNGTMGATAFGSLSWKNAQHEVKSQISYAWTNLSR
ncbi:subtilisin-like protease SBT1.8 [Impatiens glandulifera]|uniref:subtilisin-like protease SBT1.8 n=1 Tax=Impatiens glandulifera TaxID=253017 RepID=UPI001FB19F5C|nr:subtilisin-like protease SBT1.8 [Impatiens glandulifera]